LSVAGPTRSVDDAMTETQKPDTGVDEHAGVTRDPSPLTLYWSGLASTLTPEKSLDNSASAAKYLIATAALIVTISAGLGLGADTLQSPQTKILLALSALLAALTVTACLVFLFPFSRPLRSANLLEVEEWFAQTMQRAWALPLAATFLILQIACVPIAFLADSAPVTSPKFQFTYQRVPVSSGAVTRGSVSVTVSCSTCSQQPMNLTILGRTGSGENVSEVLLLSALLEPGTDGELMFKGPEVDVRGVDEVVLKVDAQEVGVLSTK